MAGSIGSDRQQPRLKIDDETVTEGTGKNLAVYDDVRVYNPNAPQNAGKPSVKFLNLVPAALLVLALSAPALAGDITLAWDANTEPDLTGYKIYFGTASRAYGASVVIGTQTTYTITGLAPGTYYFAVTAFNSAGLESGYSNEVSATVTGTPTTSRCDINGDSSVNALDVQAMVNAILGLRSSSSSLDLNGDGRVDVLDLQLLTNVVLGIRSCP
jgi:hypothetical protein